MRKGWSIIAAAAATLFLVGILLFQTRSGSILPTHSAHPLQQTQITAPSSPRIPVSNTPLPSFSPGASAAPATFRDWLRQTKAPNPSNLAHARQLAAERREQMRALFRENPARAMAESLSWSEYLSLPEELKPLVEKPFSAIVDFALLPNCPPANPSLPKIHPHQIYMDGQWHNAYVYGRKANITTKDQLPVRGILLDGEVVLADESVEQLSAADAQAVAQLFPSKTAPGISAISGQPIATRATTILLGGELYQTASQTEAASMSEGIAAAERSFHPKSVAMAMTAATVAPGTVAFNLRAAENGILGISSVWTETPKNTLAVRVNFSDAASGFTLQQMTNLMVNSSNAVKVMSYGKTWLVPRVATVTLPKTRAEYEAAGSTAIVTDTRTALTAIGINRDTYHIVVHAHPGMNVGYAGLGEVGGANNWLNGNVSLEVTVHELGHNYGLLHAHFWAGLTGMGNLGREVNNTQIEHEEYGDTFDIMGGSTLPAGQFNARGKAALNWIEQDEIIHVVTNGIYRVFRYDHQDARTNANTKLALRIPTAGGDEYWVSHRRLFTGNASLFGGANIVRSDGPNHQSLVDAMPFSRTSSSFDTDRRSDSGLPVGRSFSDPLGTVRITTIASAGIAPLEYIDVQVVFPNNSAFTFFADANFTTNGLIGSYFNVNLRSRATQDDWRTASGLVLGGRRIDHSLSFTSDGWGARAPLRLTGGTDANWENFSVQWDGYIVVDRPVRLATTSDDSSRFWIDLNQNGFFATTAPEYVNNHWGTGQGPTRGDLSPIIHPGTYRIRIQYEEGNGGNYFTIGGADIPFDVFVDESGTTPGLTGSYVGRSLRTATAQADWRTTQTIAGQRVDSYPGFTANGWGTLSSVGLVAGPNGSNSDWNDYSVQWDGFLKVSVPVRMATISDDHSRMWIDLNTNGTFATTAPEYINNGWGGSGQGMTLGQASTIIKPGTYRIRIQYEEGGGGNGFLLAGAVQSPPDATTLFNNVTFTGVDNRTTPRLVTNDFTIQFWIKTTQLAGAEQSWTDGMGLIDATAPGAPSFGISLGNGRVLFGLRGADISEITIRSEPIADDQWHHISARRIQESGEITLFIDGLPVAYGFAPTNSIDAASVLTVGSLSDGSQFFIGTIDQVKTWNTARTDEQIAADFHQARNSHSFVDLEPAVQIYDRESSVQVHWDPLSSYRILEGASTPNGTYVQLRTDQNSTNILKAPNSTRFFRVRR
jgi:hypothetical protein